MISPSWKELSDGKLFLFGVIVIVAVLFGVWLGWYLTSVSTITFPTPQADGAQMGLGGQFYDKLK